MALLPGLSLCQLRATTGVDCVYINFAGHLAEFESEARVMQVHVGLNIGCRGRWRYCFVPEVDRVGIGVFAGPAAKNLFVARHLLVRHPRLLDDVRWLPRCRALFESQHRAYWAARAHRRSHVVARTVLAHVNPLS